MPSKKRQPASDAVSRIAHSRKLLYTTRSYATDPPLIEALDEALGALEDLAWDFRRNLLTYALMNVVDYVPVVAWEHFASRETIRKWIREGMPHEYFQGKLCVKPKDFFERYYDKRGAPKIEIPSTQQ